MIKLICLYIYIYIYIYIHIYINICIYITMETNYINLEKAVSRGCQQGSCLGPGMWNIFYNSLLNIKFTGSTKLIAFADELLLLIRGEPGSEIENIANLELTSLIGQEKTDFDSRKRSRNLC